MAQGQGARPRISAREDEELDLSQIFIASLGAILIGGIYFTLPESLRIGPSWLVLVLEVVLLAPSLISKFVLRRHMPFVLTRSLTLALLVVVAGSLIASIFAFLQHISEFKSTLQLLRDAGSLWAVNVLVFASWFWEIDGGGPLKRLRAGHKAADFQFPQQVDGNTTKWAPGFVDYLFLAFCFATALSPADTPPISRRGKLLMMLEAGIALIIVAVLVGRSINLNS